VLLWAENVAFPKLHGKALNAFSGPHGKSYGIKGGIEIGSLSLYLQHASKRNVGMRFEILKSVDADDANSPI
jgi:hypothetical protein